MECMLDIGRDHLPYFQRCMHGDPESSQLLGSSFCLPGPQDQNRTSTSLHWPCPACLKSVGTVVFHVRAQPLYKQTLQVVARDVEFLARDLEFFVYLFIVQVYKFAVGNNVGGDGCYMLLLRPDAKHVHHEILKQRMSTMT